MKWFTNRERTKDASLDLARHRPHGRSQAICQKIETKNLDRLWSPRPFSLGQESLLVGLGISDLVDQDADTTLGDDVRCAVANLNGDNRVRCVDSEHGEQVDNWVCAPADNRHELGCLDLALHNCIRLAVGGGREANEEFVDNVQEEDHGKEPACPARSEVTSDDQLTVVA